VDTWDGSKTWTVTFRNTDFNPGRDWFIEVAGHDFSHWLPDFPWKHEKWTQESFLFWGLEVEKLELCEGWNLVSVPWHLDDPTPAGAFGPAWAYGTVGYGGITKAYYYTGGTYGTWKYTALNPVTGAWSGTLTQIVPGEAYWVWVSPPWMDWILRTVEPDPLAVPPTQSLKKGYNMIGTVQFADFRVDDAPPFRMMWYFRSIPDTVAPLLYAYDPCEWFYDNGPGWIRFDTGGKGKWNDEYMYAGAGYWLFLTEDWVFAP